MTSNSNVDEEEEDLKTATTDDREEDDQENQTTDDDPRKFPIAKLTQLMPMIKKMQK